MDWARALEDYKGWLTLERRLSKRTVEAYLGDVAKLRDHALARRPPLAPDAVRIEHLQDLLQATAALRPAATSQARMVSALRSFHRFLLLEKQIGEDPTDLLESPRTGRHLPVFLSVEEIDAMAAAIDLSLPLAHRDRAMLEVLYGCGLRVSELCALRISRLHFQDGYLRVVGKGDKERLVPIGPETVAHVERWRLGERQHLPVKPKAEDLLFLNARGGGISRVWVFKLVKKLAPEGRHPQGDRPAHLPALLRHPPGGRRRGPACRAGNAGPRQHHHHGDLHPPGPRIPAQQHPALPPARRPH
jgi:integrase/recombinase XerD